MVRLSDIAKEAGVSVQTVSNVLTGRNKGAYGATVRDRAERIRAIAARLNYRPNHAARAVRTKRTKTIGLLVRGVADPSTGTMVDTFERAFHRHGYRLLLGISGGHQNDAAGYLRQFPGSFVDGVINADPFLAADLVVDALRPLPVLSYNRDHASCPARINYARLTEMGLTYLLGLGHRRIGLLHGPKWDATTKTVLATYKTVLAGAGIKPMAAWAADANWELAAAERVTPGVLRTGCTAILAIDDWSALGAIQAIRQAGWRVPEDVSVIGADDLPLAQISEPKLTTFRYPYEALAAKHVEVMLARLQGQPLPPPALLEHELVVRQSAAPPASSPSLQKGGPAGK